ncbi:hypothetical protein HMPREF1864_01219 [Peptoniphilus sp. DNF00840]|nr:hypothetical protein HMPREF1864_01219 [Peptoniphilus sp. DNF00840]
MSRLATSKKTYIKRSRLLATPLFFKYLTNLQNLIRYRYKDDRCDGSDTSRKNKN